MRILTLSNVTVDPSTGSGYVVANYASGLRRRGHVVDVFGAEQLLRFRQVRRGARYRLALAMLLRCVQAWSSGRYDVVELYGAEGWLAALVLRRVLKARCLVVFHSNGLETHYSEVERTAARGELEPERKWWQMDVSRFFAAGFRSADAIVTVSEWDRDFGLTRGYGNSEHLVAIENPLLEEYLGNVVVWNREKVIGYCGNWLPRKGILAICKDMPRLLREWPEWSFMIVGVGDDFRREQHFPRDVCERISVIPFADRVTTLRGLYSKMAILIMPSVYESFGMVAVEAMACGCAVVGTRVGVLAGLKDGEEVALMRGRGSPVLYESVRELMADPAQRRRIAEGGYRRVQRLAWADSVERLEKLYRAWLDEKQQSADRGRRLPARSGVALGKDV